MKFKLIHLLLIQTVAAIIIMFWPHEAIDIYIKERARSNDLEIKSQLPRYARFKT